MRVMRTSPVNRNHNWMLVIILLMVLAVIHMAAAQKADGKSPAISVVGVWKTDRLGGGKGTVVLAVKANHTWIQKNPDDPSDFDPKYDAGNWTLKGLKLTLNRPGQGAQARNFIISKDAKQLNPVDAADVVFHRQK